MDYNLNYPGRGRQRRSGNAHRKANVGKKKQKVKVPRKERIKAALSPFSPSKLAKHYDEQDKEAIDREKEEKEEDKRVLDVHTIQTPLSVPVSPSTSSSSDQQEDTSYLSSRDDHSYGPSSCATSRPHDAPPRYDTNERLMRMTASISSRRASVDLSSVSRPQFKPTTDQGQARKSTISAYLNVEGADEVVAETTCDSAWKRQDESDCFRICIEADETSRSVRSQ